MSFKTLSIALLAVAASAAHANLLTNGSFENVVLPSKNWDLFDTIPGWTALADKIEVGQAGVYGVTGQDGANVLELDANHNATVAQSLSLAAGSYSLSFLYAKRANTTDETNMIDILWNGNVIDSLSPTSTAFATKSYVVTGAAGMNTLAFRGMGSDNSLGGMIDNANLQAVPEPATMAALGAGVLGLLRRRRKA